MKLFFVRVARDESGVTAVEYGLILALIGVAIIVGATALGSAIDSLFSGLAGFLVLR
jgi:pilus assembly protein Flp/PilA